GEAEAERSTGESARGSPRGATSGPALTRRDAARAAAGAVARLAPVFGWGLLALGLLSGLDRWLGLAAVYLPTPAMWPHAVVVAAFPILAFGLAGLATVLLCRVLATLILEQIDRAGPGPD